MSDAATPAEVKETVAPAAPAAPATPSPEATPASTPAATPAETQTPETVTLDKATHDQLQKDAARAASHQRKADLYDRFVGSNGAISHFQKPASATPPAAPSTEEMEAQASAEDRKAERGIVGLVADPAYREVFDADPTLRVLFTQNPMAVLPMYASDAVDADDAITLIKEQLNGLKKPATPATPPADAKPDEKPAEAPNPGVVNPSGAQPDEAYENARKNPNTESALAGMIGAKIRQG